MSERYRRPEKQGGNGKPMPPYRPSFRNEAAALLRVSEAKRPEAAMNLVRKGTEESFDVFSMLELIHLGLDFADRKDTRSTGEHILQGVETYLLQGQIISKHLLPRQPVVSEDTGVILDVQNEQNFDCYTDLYHESKRMMERRAMRQLRQSGKAATHTEISHLLAGVEKTVSLKAGDAARATINIRSADARSANMQLTIHHASGGLFGRAENLDGLRQEEQTVTNSMARRIELVTVSMNLSGKKETIMNAPERLIEICMREPGSMGRFDFTETRFDGVSLKDILAEGDGAARARMTLSYVAALPKGDVFWRQLARHVFFSPQLAPVEAKFSDPSVSERIFRTQVDMAHLMFGHDPQGVEFVARAIRAVDRESADFLITALINAAKYFPYTRSVIFPGTSMSEYAEQDPFYRKVLEAYAADVLGFRGDEVGLALIDEVMQWYMEGQRAGTLDRLRGFVKDPERMRLVEKTFQDHLDTSFRDTHTEFMIKTLAERMGGQSWDVVSGIDLAELDEETNDMIQAFTSRQMMGYWPNRNSLPTVRFEGMRLETFLGLNSITFAAPPLEDTGRNLQFVIHVGERNMGIRGELPVDFLTGAGDMTLSVDLATVPGLASLIRSVVVANFHDIVLRNRLVSTQAGGSPDTAGSDGSRSRRHRSFRPRDPEETLPRNGKSVLDGPYKPTAPETFSTSALQEDIDAALKREDKDYRPRTIDPHPQALRGAARYQHAVRRYVAAGEAHQKHDGRQASEELAMLAAEMEEARSTMYNMSPAKQAMLSSLPPTFRGDMRTIADPVTGETVYLTTWVADYKSPRPDSETMRSLRKMRQRFFKAGPQTRFLDVLMMKILATGAENITPEPQN